MSDSINEQRCERNGLPISGCAASEYDCAKFGVCAASQPEPATLRITTYGGGKTVQHWQLRLGNLFLADTSVQARVEQWRQLIPAAPSVSTDHTDEKQSCPFCTRLRNGEYTTGADQGVMRFEPLNPVTPGHMLFMPKDHHADAAKRLLMADYTDRRDPKWWRALDRFLSKIGWW